MLALPPKVLHLAMPNKHPLRPLPLNIHLLLPLSTLRTTLHTSKTHTHVLTQALPTPLPTRMLLPLLLDPPPLSHHSA